MQTLPCGDEGAIRREGFPVSQTTEPLKRQIRTMGITVLVVVVVASPFLAGGHATAPLEMETTVTEGAGTNASPTAQPGPATSPSASRAQAVMEDRERHFDEVKRAFLEGQINIQELASVPIEEIGVQEGDVPTRILVHTFTPNHTGETVQQSTSDRQRRPMMPADGGSELPSVDPPANLPVPPPPTSGNTAEPGAVVWVGTGEPSEVQPPLATLPPPEPVTAR